MEEMDLVIQDETHVEELITTTENDGRTYSSFKPETTEEKIKLFNMLQSADKLLIDMVGETIELKHIYVKQYNKVNKDTGELEGQGYRTLLIDNDGYSFATGSYGIYFIVRDIIQTFGDPNSWEKPLKVKVIEKPFNDHKALSLEIIG